jgi:hypothetical protein
MLLNSCEGVEPASKFSGRVDPKWGIKMDCSIAFNDEADVTKHVSTWHSRIQVFYSQENVSQVFVVPRLRK